MAKADGQDNGLTREEKVANLILDRHGAWPPVNVRRIASEYARLEVCAFPVICDAVTIRDPEGLDRPTLLLNSRSTNLETRRRFTISHEIGHLKIPGHSGSIACHIDESEPSVSSDHYLQEAEANRFASEILMPTRWIREVIANEQTIEKIVDRVEGEAEVSRTAARIKLLSRLPPGFVCVEYDPNSGKMKRIDESGKGNLSLFIEPGDRTSFHRLSKALEFYSIDEHEIGLGNSRVRWWRLDCRAIPPMAEVNSPSADILRSISEGLFDTRESQNKTIFLINGYASNGYQKSLDSDVASIYGALNLRFSKKDIRESSKLQMVISHQLWSEYLIAKSAELANGQTSRKKALRRKSS